ncbi:Kdo domain containing protein [Leeuwenhoekiella marinoflava]|uniref:Kdo domain containing protein n=1 Tax=Leeuwenhoekiella marinoflava TaxID=988 RepID=UPI003002F723
MKIVVHKSVKNSLLKLKEFFFNFEKEGSILADGNRNQIKVYKLEGEYITIKAFKVPNLVNKIAYQYFRKSKAQRSYEYACKLLENGILTPQPLGYAIENDGLLFGKSFYACKLVEADATYRTLVNDENYPNRIEILKAFTRFTFEMHQKGIHFLDHSPGNTLIVKNMEGYDFYLVDLNRMEFRELDFETRIQNFARLTPIKEMVAIMAEEYARIGGFDENKTRNSMWKATQDFQESFKKKQELKKKLKFWKK